MLSVPTSSRAGAHLAELLPGVEVLVDLPVRVVPVVPEDPVVLPVVVLPRVTSGRVRFRHVRFSLEVVDEVQRKDVFRVIHSSMRSKAS